MRDFNHSVNILVKAYMNDTLEHGNDCSCAVGNLIADSLGLSRRARKYWPAHWYDYAICNVYECRQEALNEIELTGYTVEEIVRIERAFESSRRDYGDVKYIGLMRTVDVLADIHGIDLTTREESKKLFVKV